MEFWLVVLGVLAGGLTTVAGMGGGVMLVLALSLVASPVEALAITSPALLIGNLHRVAVGRRAIDRAVARPFVLGALPGSLLGGLVAVAVPPALLQALLLLTTAMALARALGWWSFRPRAAALVPAGAAIGAAAATTGSAGLLVAPLIHAAGLTGARYVATTSAAAVSMHLSRILAYGVGGHVTAATLLGSAALALAILVGNGAGELVRRRLTARAAVRLELAVLLACVALALAGLA